MQYASHLERKAQAMFDPERIDLLLQQLPQFIIGSGRANIQPVA